MQLFKIVDSATGETRLCEATNFFDIDGDETDDIEFAVSAVVKWSEDKWIAFCPDAGNVTDYVQAPQ